MLWVTASAVAFLALRLTHPWSEHLATFLLAYAAAWVCCVGVSRSGVTLPVLLVGALLWRLLFVLLPPTLSQDVFRYVWEGQIQWHGGNPFVQAPSSPLLQALRNDIWPHINHPEASAIYPPMTQLVFKGLAAFCGVSGFKLVFCLLDLVLVVVLARGLQRRGAAAGRLAWYAWNPLVIVEVAGSGHFEPLALLPMLLGIHWLTRRRTAAWLALASSIGIKYAASLLLPAFWRIRRPTWGAAVAALTLWGVCLLPYRDAGSDLFASLLLYADKWRYNDMLFGLLALLCGSLLRAKAVAAALVVVLLVVVSRGRQRLPVQCLVVLTAALALSPTIHPWYLLWIAVLLPWAPSWALMAWTGSIALAYVFLFPMGTGSAVQPSAVWVRLAQMLPVALGAFFDVRHHVAPRPVAAPRSPERHELLRADPGHSAAHVVAPRPPHNERIVLMMPALDEEESLPLVLEDLAQLQEGTSLLDEILVVDNGSTDRTRDIARGAGATVLEEAQRGYGAACLRALQYLEAQPPDILVFMDADRSDDATQIPDLVRPLREDGVDLVIGSRTLGSAEAGALLPQARFGNWLATSLIRWRTGFRYTDLGPFRAVRFAALQRLRMSDRDFGWTVEMQVRAVQENLRIREIPVRYRRRVGRSKISGTIGGSVRAGMKILATLWRLRRSS